MRKKIIVLLGKEWLRRHPETWTLSNIKETLTLIRWKAIGWQKDQRKYPEHTYSGGKANEQTTRQATVIIITTSKTFLVLFGISSIPHLLLPLGSSSTIVVATIASVFGERCSQFSFFENNNNTTVLLWIGRPPIYWIGLSVDVDLGTCDLLLFLVFLRLFLGIRHWSSPWDLFSRLEYFHGRRGRNHHLS